MYLKIKILLVALVIWGCDEPIFKSNPIPRDTNVFLREASIRGITIDVGQVNITLGSNFEYKYEAYFNPNNNTIYFDTTSWQWNNVREELIAHELGHALLNRQHCLDRLKNGMYKSLMGNTSNPYYSGWSLSTSHKELRRKYYYDELFKPETEDPGDIR